ncbi:hypothetical protein BMI85_20430 [Thioclava sp. DLFJ4-1]|nr:hypothetical protein BMI85_20430 [Thioclava sp. DLFJ4-1]
MDLRQLRYFLEIVEQGSISRAAERLRVAQPALSIHLRNLETDLDATLLLRGRFGVQPTEAGQLLVRHARFILNEVTKAEDEIRYLGKEPTGEVRVGFSGTISNILAVPLIEAARDRFPGIRLTISEAMSGFVAEWLGNGEVDLAILYSHASEGALEAEKLLDEELMAFAAPRRLKGDSLSIGELAKRPLILPSRAHGLRQMLDAAAMQAGQIIKPSVEVDSYTNIKALVMRGQGLSILPLHAIASEKRTGQVSVVRIAPELMRSAYLVHRANAPLSRTTQLVRDLLREVTVDLVQQGRWVGARLAPDIIGKV